MKPDALVDEILFVIVLYKKQPDESLAYISIRNATQGSPLQPAILLYDNSPEAHEVNGGRIIYRHDPENGGVSKAYNEGFLVALDSEKKWLMLLDQDTAPDADFLSKLSEAIVYNPASVAFVPRLGDKHGVVSPFRWSLGRGIRMSDFKPKLLLKKFRFLNSGLLISTHAFGKAGGYHKTIPLYFSDIAFGENLMKVTDHFVVIDTVLEHGFSATENISLDAALHRYSYFCAGALTMGRISGPFWLYYLRALLRGLNLSVQYRKMDFIKTFFST